MDRNAAVLFTVNKLSVVIVKLDTLYIVSCLTIALVVCTMTLSCCAGLETFCVVGRILWICHKC